MYRGSVKIENVLLEVDPKYVIGVPEAFTNFLLFSSCPRQASVHNFPLFSSCPRQTPMHHSYFSALIMFVCTLSFDLRRRIYTI
jgi:hypothetical protein